MPTILLIRHGENDLVGKRLAGRMPGVHLNERGRNQADVIAAALFRAPIKALYSSPLERAAETAAPLAQALNLPVAARDGLIEVDFGQWQGMTGKQMQRSKLWTIVQNKPSEMRFPQGESFAEAQERMVREVDAIAALHDEHDLVACFSHSDIIKLAVAHYLGMPLDCFQRISIDTAAVTVLHIGEHGPHLGPINMPLTFRMVVDLAPMFPPPPKGKGQGDGEKGKKKR